MADPVNETELGMVPVEETAKVDTPQPQPINAWASELEPEDYTPQQHWFKRGTRVVLPAMLSAILGAAAAVTVMHFTAPKRMAATSVAITSVQSPDDHHYRSGSKGHHRWRRGVTPEVHGDGPPHLL
ncbi:hypothetical protein [Mycobacterium sp. 1165196.3]|uniref:hypothetical protein n=1 Tax=Mycobacterium sp. 1165196.3 TaxID=1834071 RepID=UPI0012EA61D2|nr:hypothetical protein [Mycobacterium sp. 1165196.3]